MSEQTPSPLGDTFDRVRRNLKGLPDTVTAGPSTIETFTPLVELAETWIVSTVRQKERGDIIFLQIIDGSGGRRFVVPPDVADAIARQRDSLTTKNRRKGARQAVETRAARGIEPAFLKSRKRGVKS